MMNRGRFSRPRPGVSWCQQLTKGLALSSNMFLCTDPTGSSFHIEYVVPIRRDVFNIIALIVTNLWNDQQVKNNNKVHHEWTHLVKKFWALRCVDSSILTCVSNTTILSTCSVRGLRPSNNNAYQRYVESWE